MASTDFSTLNLLLNEIARAESDLGNPDTIWYRGVTKYSHELIPSLFRSVNGLSVEADFFHRFRLTAQRIFPNLSTDWDLVVAMQHYGIPTRLLDWTEVLGIALFFASLGNQDQDAAIYILDPKKLNSKWSKDHIINLGTERNFGYEEFYLRKDPAPPMVPMAAEALYKQERLFAQRGKFTVHGDNLEPVEVVTSDCVRKVRLPVSARHGVKEFLRVAGISEYSVFPDMEGLAPNLANLVGFIPNY